MDVTSQLTSTTKTAVYRNYDQSAAITPLNGYVAEPKCMYYVENYYVVIVQLPIVRTCTEQELIYDQIKIT